MFRSPRHPSDSWLYQQQRRQREDDAPRLKVVAPALVTLKFTLHSVHGDSRISGSAYVKVIPVQNAPAHFEIPCSDTRCKEGGHDLTYEILRALKAEATVFEGEDLCLGTTGSAECNRSLKYSLSATYKA
ncbi:MAG TPA: hypothetical protein VL137_11605 [Polyangiaceae bacterium]|nr:hypothetical protein [Polyangiaceae bacterium]